MDAQAMNTYKFYIYDERSRTLWSQLKTCKCPERTKLYKALPKLCLYANGSSYGYKLIS